MGVEDIASWGYSQIDRSVVAKSMALGLHRTLFMILMCHMKVPKSMKLPPLIYFSLRTVQYIQGYAAREFAKQGVQPGELAIISKEAGLGVVCNKEAGFTEDASNRINCVPANSLFEQFVKVDDELGAITGFVVSVFDEMMRGINQPFEYIPFQGSYDELIRQIPEKRFDAIAGDVTIISSRHNLVDFTQPYTESGLEMIAHIRSRLSNQAWLFLKPFTAGMWWLIAGITVYNGFIVWLIEKNHVKDYHGSVTNQIGIILWLSFNTLITTLLPRSVSAACDYTVNLSKYKKVAYLLLIKDAECMQSSSSFKLSCYFVNKYIIL